MSILGVGKEKKLLKWQKAVITDSPDHLIYTEERLAKMSVILIENDVRVISESLEIIANTKNADTEQSRRRLIAKRLKRLEILDSFTGNKYRALIAAAKKESKNLV